MRTTTLGPAGLAIGRIGLGRMGMSWAYDEPGRDEAESVKVIRQALVAQVAQIARQVAATPAQVALAWLLAQGEHVAPIPGTKRTAHLLANAAAAGIDLPAQARGALDSLPVPAAPRY